MARIRSKNGPSKDGRIEEIRTFAIKLFARKGYEGTTMREIAEALNMQAGSLYYWYSGKQDLLFDVLKTIIDELNSGLEQIITSYSNPILRLEEAIKHHVLFNAERKDEAFISHSELRSLTPNNYKLITAKRDWYDRQFQQILLDGMLDGSFNVAESDLKIVCYGILRLCSGVATWFSPDGPFTPSRIAEIYSRLIMGGLLLRKSEYVATVQGQAQLQF